MYYVILTERTAGKKTYDSPAARQACNSQRVEWNLDLLNKLNARAFLELGRQSINSQIKRELNCSKKNKYPDQFTIMG